MSASLVKRVAAFFDTVWSFILTLVRSLLTLFSLRRRASDPFTLPSANRTPGDALARAHSHLRPILLTPRSIVRSPVHYTQHAQSTRTRSATSTIFSEHNEVATASAPQASYPQRTSPKLDPNDPELGASATTPVTADQVGPPGTGATSFRGGMSDTSSSVLPLTPPDRCYLAPIPSVTDCPYAEPWPVNGVLDRGKPRLQASPLKVSINTESVFAESFVSPMGSPPLGRWNPVQIWTSTPCKNDYSVPDPALSLSDYRTRSTIDPSPALANVSHALISRSQSSIQPYDASDASPLVNYPPVAGTLQRPDVYACTWRRHNPRVPGKPNRTARMHIYARSHSHNTDAHVSSPVYALSPALCESATEDEDEDEMPLGRLRERLARRGPAVGTNVDLGVPLDAGMGIRTAAAMSPRTKTRTMSEGCLLAFSESTPTRVGRHVLSLALDGDGYSSKDWFEALSLR